MPRLASPSHPGQFIRGEIIEPLGLSITQAAKVERYQAPDAPLAEKNPA